MTFVDWIILFCGVLNGVITYIVGSQVRVKAPHKWYYIPIVVSGVLGVFFSIRHVLEQIDYVI